MSWAEIAVHVFGTVGILCALAAAVASIWIHPYFSS